MYTAELRGRQFAVHKDVCAIARIMYIFAHDLSKAGHHEPIQLAATDMIELDTLRLRLRELRDSDAPFILELLNDGAFLRYIGDRHVRAIDQARDYIAHGPRNSYAEHNFGLLLVEAKKSGLPLGLCGLVQRDYLPDPDLGFAFLPRFRAQGFCMEASRAVLDDATRERGFKRIAAIVQPDNAASIGLLAKLGFVLDRPFKRSINDRELLVLAYFA